MWIWFYVLPNTRIVYDDKEMEKDRASIRVGCNLNNEKELKSFFFCERKIVKWGVKKESFSFPFISQIKLLYLTLFHAWIAGKLKFIVI